MGVLLGEQINVLNLLDLTPPEIWTQIFSYLTNIKDIASINITCQAFKEIIPKAVEVLKGSKNIIVPSNILNKWTNLRSCQHRFVMPSNETMKCLILFQSIDFLINPANMN